MRCHPKIHLLQWLGLFFAFIAFNATATTYYVDINSPSPTPPLHQLEHGLDQHPKRRQPNHQRRSGFGESGGLSIGRLYGARWKAHNRCGFQFRDATKRGRCICYIHHWRWYHAQHLFGKHVSVGGLYDYQWLAG